MAALKEKSLSRGHLTGTERDTFSKRREHSIKKRPVLLQSDFSTLQSHQHLRAMQLQQRWQELRERELTAQQHNRQLLQRFDEAQDTLREMLTLTAAMKTIRTEYERYLEESSPRWQQQLKEKTKAAQRKRMEAYLRLCLNKADERVAKSSADPPLFSQGPTAKSQTSHMGYNQDGSLLLPYVQPSWQTNPQSQMAHFPIRALHQPQGSPHVPPPPTHPPPHPFHLTSTPAHPHPWPRQDPPGWASPQPDYPWSWTAGAAGIPSGPEALWGPPEGRVSQVVREEGESSRAPGSRRESGGGSSGRHFSQELDIKPVRLSGGPAESSESSRESNREERKKREKRGRPQRTSSERERRSSQESSRTSSAVVTAALAVAQSSESDTSSEKGRSSLKRRRRRRCGGLGVGSPGAEKVVKDGTRSERDDSEESRPAGEEVWSPHEDSSSEKVEEGSPDDKSESCREESGSGGVSAKTENGGEIEEEQESSSSEHSSAGEKSEEEEEHERDDRDAEEKEHGQRDEEQEEGDVKDEAPERKNTTEEEEETEAEDETEEQKSEEEDGRDSENGKQGSASSPDEEADEDVSEGGGGQTEEDEEEEGGVVEEERDSEDSIISPQEKSRKMHVIPEEAGEDEEEEEEEGRKTGSSDDDFSNEDIEHLLAPQAGSQRKEDKDQRADEKPKAVCDNVGIFQVEQDRSTAPHHQSDSDEFDHFYD